MGAAAFVFSFLEIFLLFLFTAFFLSFYSFLNSKHVFYNYSAILILYSYYNTGQSGKTFNYKRLRQTRSAFNEHVSPRQICKFQTRIFTSTFLRFVHYVARFSDHSCLGMYSQSTLHDRMLGQYSLQPCPHDYLRIHKMRFCKYWYCLG